MSTFERSTTIAAPPHDVWQWHTRPGALERMIPPWERVRVVERSGTIRDGDRVTLELRRGPLRRRWTALHSGFEEGTSFCDTQIEGPFARWRHRHSFLPVDAGCRVVDEIDYELPALARPGGRYVRRSLERTFAFRHRRLRDDVSRHTAAAGPPLRVAITGATGMIGRELASFLESGGHDVVRIVRSPAALPGEVSWDPAGGVIDVQQLEGLDAVVHLSGRRIDTRWTSAGKREIRASRVDTTALLARTLATLESPPKTLVTASAIGFYGSRSDEELTEESGPGSGFLAELCRDWEAAAEPAQTAGIRVVNLRTAVILSLRGTPLSRLVLPSRLGLGAVVGRGDQSFSWIVLDDVLGAVLHLLRNPSLAGPVNVAAPSPVSFREFADTLAAVLRRPRFLRVPRAAIEAALGEMGRETALASQRVVPRRLLDSGFEFFYPQLGAALAHELGRASTR